MRSFVYAILPILLACSEPPAAPQQANAPNVPPAAAPNAAPNAAPAAVPAAAPNDRAPGACEACKPGTDRAAQEQPRFDVPRSDTIVLGDARGAHRLVVFTDPDCPYCARMHENLEGYLAEHRDVRVEVRMFPLPFHGDGAKTASKVALYAARSGNGDAFLRTYFRTQGDDATRLRAAMSAAHVAESELPRILEDRGIDAALAKDLAEGKAAGVSGTPSSFVDGTRVVGAQPMEVFTAQLRL